MAQTVCAESNLVLHSEDKFFKVSFNSSLKEKWRSDVDMIC
jgi:hypothetical protein